MFSDKISHRLQKENKTKNKRSEINIRSRHNPTKITQVARVFSTVYTDECWQKKYYKLVRSKLQAINNVTHI